MIKILPVTIGVGSLAIPGWILHDSQKTTLSIRKAQLINLKYSCNQEGCKEFYDQQLRDLEEWDNKSIWPFLTDRVPPIQRYVYIGVPGRYYD